MPKSLQSFWSSTIHSESKALVPADIAQSPPLPVKTNSFRTSVWSLVALATPATSHPDPGSGPMVPMMSTMIVSPPANSKRPYVSSPLDKYVYVMSATARMVESDCGCATMYVPPGAISASNGKLNVK